MDEAVVSDDTLLSLAAISSSEDSVVFGRTFSGDGGTSASDTPAIKSRKVINSMLDVIIENSNAGQIRR